MSSQVAVVITTYNDAHFLQDALESVLAQSCPADEIIVVDDGSRIDPRPLLANYASVTFIRKSNGGLASARNVGLRAATRQFVLFLDADDRLTPAAIETGLSCLRANPDAVFAHGGHRRIDSAGMPISADKFEKADGFADLLTGNRIGMHATVLYRREPLLAAGGFDERLARCEDYDVYLRLSQTAAIACHPAIVAEYRWHGSNMSRYAPEMLAAVLDVHARYRPDAPGLRARWDDGRRNFTSYYEAEAAMADGVQPRQSLLRRGARRVKRTLLRSWPPALGSVRPAHLAGDRPISLDFGWDRGLPIDRYYIERFLQAHAADIRGRVLEVGDAAYSRRVGGAQITQQDVLHVSRDASEATIVGSLEDAGTLPRAAFDCIVLTQTLHLIFDLQGALVQLADALRPGGVLLLTSPGISQLDRGEWGDTWYWSFTAPALRRLLQPHFPAGNFDVQAHGNVFAATSYLHGLAVEEVDTRRLDPVDPAYPVIITVRAQRPND
ncbi:Glycosyltransferase involved in cell wall bisynthesis [Sphingomonas guangdongensis]|uniref:Glycosyltransferase involved in cell wall bisynthesis n=1 Tax=Sphingomonas guangdongensis TaxID=1141890 RepID=A0A285QL27_9SPHN|nr:glycosyltransferase [Sphingomonas guangdongensis]SOB80772.1 Glycosyltransferase involved in cell wall bisynthesis [Sphingomonas guangdongensis]